MAGPVALALVCLLCLLKSRACEAVEPTGTVDSTEHVRRVKLFDSVYMKVPDQNNSTSILSFEVTNNEEGSGRGKQKKLLEKFMPMFVMPFILQSTIIPLFLGMIKFLLFKSLMIGKLALVLIILNSFKNHNAFRGRKDSVIAKAHYGYNGNGMEEYGSYFN